MELFDSQYFSGQGKLFLYDRDSAGKPNNGLFVGDLSSASFSSQVENVELIENVTGAGGIGSSFTKSVKYTGQFVFRSIKPDHLALALQGSSTAKASTSVTDEAHMVKLGRFSPLAHAKVSAVTITGVGGSPTYVADTDYKIHAAEGLIEWLSGGTVTDGLAVVIDYTYAAQHHVQVAPANIYKYAVFAGMNRANNNKQTRCEMYKIRLDPSAMGLIQDTHGEMTASFQLLQDTLRTSGDQYYAWKTED